MMFSFTVARAGSAPDDRPNETEQATGASRARDRAAGCRRDRRQARPAWPWPGTWPGRACGSWCWRPAPSSGHTWRSRWDSLTLFTPAQYDAPARHAVPRPGRHLPDQGSGRRLPAGLRDRLRPAGPAERPGHPASAGPARASRSAPPTRRFRARQVVVATGPFQVPFVPPAAQRLDASVTQLHSAGYRNPQALPAGPVLVVGGGNSGFQIAEELAADPPGRPVDRRPSCRCCRSGWPAGTCSGG